MDDPIVPDQDLSESLHDRDWPVSGASRHYRKQYLGFRDNIYAVETRRSAELALVARRTDLGDGGKAGREGWSVLLPGTEAEIAGTRPTFWKTYDGKIPNDERVDTVLGWFDLPMAERPRIFTMYFSDVDDAGHWFSPDSPQTRDAVMKVDTNLKRLIDGLKARKIDKKVNIIIVSDHGMAAVDQRNAVVLDDYFPEDMAERILRTGEIVQIFPKDGKEDTIMNGLKNIKHATCWRKAEIPARLHYQASPRIAPIVCSSDEGWFMTQRKRYEEQKKRSDFNQLKGAHGYDNALVSMRATFIAHGKAFKKRTTVEPFENIHVYELMCKILGLRPAKNDGDLNRVRGILR